MIGNFLPEAPGEVGEVVEEPETGRPVDQRPEAT
jgi:hypothetical protein